MYCDDCTTCSSFDRINTAEINDRWWCNYLDVELEKYPHCEEDRENTCKYFEPKN